MTDMYVVQTLIAPRKYIQGRHLLSSLGKYVGELGNAALVVADETVWGLVRGGPSSPPHKPEYD